MSNLSMAKIALASTALMVSFVANADTQLRQAADWSLFQSDSGICYMQTDNNDFGSGGDGGSFQTGPTMYFSLSKYKDRPEMPLEVMVKLTSNNNKHKGAIASISGANSIALADLDGGNRMLWGVPKNLSNFINQIKNGRDLIKVKGVGGRREEARLSTNGFKDILREMEVRCNGGASLVNAEFEANFFAGVSDSIDPLRIDVTKASQLRSIHYAAYQAAFNISNASNDLAKLLAKYQPLIDELAINRNEAKQIQDVSLPASRQLLADSQKQQVDARAEIARIDAAIPALNSKIAASQKLYDAARAILAPHEAEYNRITGNLSSAQSTLAEAQNRLAYVDNRLRDGAQQIANLDSEADSLERSLPQKLNDLDRARSYLRDAQSRRANFNVAWERDSRLRNNFEYSRLQSDRQNFSNNLRQIEGDLQRTRMERDRIARDLQQCRQGMVIEAAEPRPPGGGGLVPGPRPPGGGGGLVPGPPGGGNPGNPPVEPPAPRDCSQLEQALNNANSMVAQRENEQRNIANRLNEVNSRMNQIERQIDFDVRREYDNLVNIENQAEREESRIENSVNVDQNRISQIRGSDIPRLEREQTQLSNERPSVISRINESTSAVARLTDVLVRFRAATDWDRKANEVQKTGNQLSSDQANLANAQAQKQAAQNRLQSGANTEAQAKAQIDSLNARAAALNARKVQLDAGLAKLPEERAQFDATLAQQRVELTNRTAQFTDMLK
ncbi:MAG: hypothetical protein ABL930_03290 [Pseudobdellovibrio sp.]